MSDNGANGKTDKAKPDKDMVKIDFSRFKTVRDIYELRQLIVRGDHEEVIQLYTEIVKAHPKVKDPSNADEWWNLSPPDWRLSNELFQEKFGDIYKS